VIWTNKDQVGEAPNLEFDGFYVCDGFSIDQCFFLDESLLFVLINKKEVRILYTQNFTAGLFDPKMVERKKGAPQGDPLQTKKYFL